MFVAFLPNSYCEVVSCEDCGKDYIGRRKDALKLD